MATPASFIPDPTPKSFVADEQPDNTPASFSLDASAIDAERSTGEFRRPRLNVEAIDQKRKAGFLPYSPEQPVQQQGPGLRDVEIGAEQGLQSAALPYARAAQKLYGGHLPEMIEAQGPSPEELASRQSLGSKILQGAASAPFAVARYATVPGGPVASMAGADTLAAAAEAESPEEAAKAGIQAGVRGGAMGAALEPLAPYGRLRRMAGGAAIGAGATALEGGSPADIAASAVTMGGLSGLHGNAEDLSAPGPVERTAPAAETAPLPQLSAPEPIQPQTIPVKRTRAKRVKPAPTDTLLANTPPMDPSPTATAAQPTVPESPDTIQMQVMQLGRGQRRVVMFPKGTDVPQLPDGTATHQDSFGNSYAYNPDAITPQMIDSAVATNRLTSILGDAEQGMGAPDKSDLQGPVAAVVGRTMDGTTVQSTATDAANLQATIDATKKVTPPGGTVSVEPPETEIANREAAGAPPPQEQANGNGGNTPPVSTGAPAVGSAGPAAPVPQGNESGDVRGLSGQGGSGPGGGEPPAAAGARPGNARPVALDDVVAEAQRQEQYQLTRPGQSMDDAMAHARDNTLTVQERGKADGGYMLADVPIDWLGKDETHVSPERQARLESIGGTNDPIFITEPPIIQDGQPHLVPLNGNNRVNYAEEHGLPTVRAFVTKDAWESMERAQKPVVTEGVKQASATLLKGSTLYRGDDHDDWYDLASDNRAGTFLTQSISYAKQFGNVHAFGVNDELHLFRPRNDQASRAVMDRYLNGNPDPEDLAALERRQEDDGPRPFPENLAALFENPSHRFADFMRQEGFDGFQIGMFGRPGKSEVLVFRREALEPSRLPAMRPEAGSGGTISLDATQQAGGQPGGEGGEVPVARRPGTTPAPGEDTAIRVPGRTDAYAAHYAVRELGDTYPSHDPFTFDRNPEYRFINDRDYSDPINRARVVDNSLPAKFDPAYLISDNPDATNGPSVIDAEGNVLGGNNRRMTLERVYKQNPKGAKAYRDLLMKKAAYFGIDPREVAQMKQPILVREMEPGYEPQRAITDLNKPPTAALSTGEKALADARSVTPETAKYIGQILESAGPDASLNDVLNGKSGPTLVNHLIDRGIFTEAERPSLLDSETGNVTKSAKDRISKMLVGNLFEDSNEFQSLPPSLRNKLERIAPLLKQVEGRQDWDLTPDVRGAISQLEYERAYKQYADDYKKAHGFGPDSDLAKNQEVMFGETSGPVAPEVTDRQRTLADFIGDTSGTGIAKALRSYVEDANNGDTMFSTADPASAFDKAFGAAKEFLASESGQQHLERIPQAIDKAVGVTPFVQQDVLPRVQSILEGTRDTVKHLVEMVAPRVGVPTKELDEVYRLKGGRDAANYLLQRQLDQWNKRVGQMSQEQMVDFVDRQKQGQPQADPELQALSDFMRKTDDSVFAELKKYRPSLDYLQNHYRVLWKVIPRGEGQLDVGPGKKQFFGGRRPLQGNRGMLKQHTLDTMSEGIERGGVPYSYNPIRMFEASYADAMQFITAQKMWETFKKSGAAKFVKNGAAVPEGYTRLNDGIARVYFKADQGLVNTGEWYVQEGAARVLNNFLSRDLIREQPLGRALMGVKNATTAVELSLSPFHLMFEGNEAIGSNIGIGLRKIYNLGMRKGDVGAAAQGVKDIATAPTAAVTAALEGARAKAAFGDFDAFSKTPEGVEFLKKNPDVRQDVQAFFDGGGQLRMNDDYRVQAYNNFQEALNSGNRIGAILRGVPLLNQQIMSPLFEHYIPNLKLGFFLREYSLARQEYADRLASGEMTSTQLARNVVDSVENRFGEMNFDNLFWNRTFKTAAQLAFRSVTWKLGNLRADLGAISGQGTELSRAMRNKQLPLLHPNMAWFLGMTAWTAALGATIHTLATGQAPQKIKDFVYPVIDGATGIRVSLPTYWRDMIHGWHSPGGYLKSSLSGDIGKMADIWENKDFYGNEVYSPDDPLPQRVLSMVGHMVPRPFSVSSGLQAKQQGGSDVARAAGYLGFTKAPRYIEDTPAQQAAYDYALQHREVGSRTQQQAARSQAINGILSLMRAGRDATPQIGDAMRAGTISAHDLPRLRKMARQNPLTSQVARLSVPEALNVYDQANDQERQALARTMRVKLAGARSKPYQWTPQAEQLAQQYFGIRPIRRPDLSAPGPIQ